MLLGKSLERCHVLTLIPNMFNSIDFCRSVFQGVHNMWQFQPVEGSEELKSSTDNPTNKFVMIGRNLDKVEIKSAFKNCFLKDP